jgi:hypothetical protein
MLLQSGPETQTNGTIEERSIRLWVCVSYCLLVARLLDCHDGRGWFVWKIAFHGRE